MKTDKRSQPQIKNGDILLTEIGLLTLGKTDFDNVKEFYTDPDFYKIALDIKSNIPSESSLRNRLNNIGTSMNTDILDGNISMFYEWMRRIAADAPEQATLDGLIAAADDKFSEGERADILAEASRRFGDPWR